MSFGKFWKKQEEIVKPLNADMARAEAKTAIEREIKNSLDRVNEDIRDAASRGCYTTFTTAFDDLYDNINAITIVVKNLTDRGFEVDINKGKISWLWNENCMNNGSK